MHSDRETVMPVDQSDNGEPWFNPAALTPGNRMDLIVCVPLDARPGLLPISMRTGLTNLLSIGSNTTAAAVNVEITGDPIDADWSDDDVLPGLGFTLFDDTQQSTRSIDFTPQFTVDGAPYDGEVARQMQRGTPEEWTISNSTGGAHAFHIHVKPFFITHINGEELPEDSPLRRWQGAVGLPYLANGTDGSVTVKARFETFTGKSVIHCHIQRHEDLGIMQTVKVVLPRPPSCPPK